MSSKFKAGMLYRYSPDNTDQEENYYFYSVLPFAVYVQSVTDPLLYEPIAQNKLFYHLQPLYWMLGTDFDLSLTQVHAGSATFPANYFKQLKACPDIAPECEVLKPFALIEKDQRRWNT